MILINQNSAKYMKILLLIFLLGLFLSALNIIIYKASKRKNTLKYVIKKAEPGSTIYLSPGKYTENFTLKEGVNLSGVKDEE